MQNAELGINSIPQGKNRQIRLSRESKIVLAMCAADFLITMIFVNKGKAVEGNPLMSYCMQTGWLGLAVVKAVMSIVPIYTMEWCRQYKPQFVRNMLRFLIGAYIFAYVASIIRLCVIFYS